MAEFLPSLGPTPERGRDSLYRTAQQRLWRATLDQHNIPYRSWTVYKTVDNLFKELSVGESVLGLNDSGELRRYTSVVNINVFANGPDGQRYRLVEDRQVFKNRLDEDGQPRIRRRKLSSSIGEKLILIGSPEAPEEGARRGLKEELGVEEPDDLAFIGTANYERSSQSYPGIVTYSTVYHFSAEVPYRPEGFIEDQPDKITYFVWQQL